MILGNNILHLEKTAPQVPQLGRRVGAHSKARKIRGCLNCPNCPNLRPRARESGARFLLARVVGASGRTFLLFQKELGQLGHLGQTPLRRGFLCAPTWRSVSAELGQLGRAIVRVTGDRFCQFGKTCCSRRCLLRASGFANLPVICRKVGEGVAFANLAKVREAR